MKRNKKVRTGSLQFLYQDGQVDFPGIYIDGSRAALFRHELMKLLNCLDDDYNKENLQNLANLLGEGIVQQYDPKNVTIINFKEWAIFHPE